MRRFGAEPLSANPWAAREPPLTVLGSTEAPESVLRAPASVKPPVHKPVERARLRLSEGERVTPSEAVCGTVRTAPVEEMVAWQRKGKPLELRGSYAVSVSVCAVGRNEGSAL